MHILDDLTKLLENNDFEKAHDLFLIHENLLKDNATYWNLRGYLYTRIQEYDLAITCFTNALDIDNTNFEVHYNYGFVCEQTGDFNGAAIHYGLAYKYSNSEELKMSMENIFENHDSLRKIFLAVAKGRNKSFVITSNVKWGVVYQRHHHIARALALLGYEVFYVETPIKSEFPSSTIDKNILNMASKEYKVIDNVKICSTFEGTFNGRTVASNYLDMIKFITDSIDKENDVIFLNYNTHITEFLKEIDRQNKYVIYECVDDNTDIEYAFWSNDKSIYNEQKSMELSDHIITTASTLYIKHAIVESRKNISLIRNAVNEEDFIIKEKENLEDLLNIPKPRVCYTGALYNRLDTELLFATAKDNPSVSFVVIGFGDEELIKNSPSNIYYLGPKKHSILKHYLKEMDIGIIPFKADMRGVLCCDSIKHYEYLAAGLPVITTHIPESGINKPYTYMVSNSEEFTEAINKALNQKIDENVIFEFLLSNSWLDRAADICRLADSFKESENLKNIDISENVNSLVKSFPTELNTLLYEIISKKEHSEIENLIKNNVSYKGSYIDQLYLKLLIENNKYNELLTYIKNTCNENTNELLENNILADDKNKFVKCIACVLADEYLMANKIFKDLEEKNIKILTDNTSIDKKLRNFVLKASSNYFETDKNESNYTIYLLDLKGNTTKEFKEKVCSDEKNLIIVTEDKLQEFLQSKTAKDFKNKENIKIIVPFDDDFVKTVRLLSTTSIDCCHVAAEFNDSIVLTEINKEVLTKVKNKEYINTISVFKRNAADGNVEAILRRVPEHLKNKVKIRMISEDKVYSLEESILTPLLSSVTISGFAVFGNYPKHTYNIELWHGGLGLKTCGLMDKVNKNSGGSIDCFSKIDKICLASYMNCVQFTSCFAIPEDKYEITGLPRTDLLLNPNSRLNLENLLGVDISNKKVIMNMPTFHLNSNSNRIEGNSLLSDYFKIPNFDYSHFDKFLEENNMICISKAHHNEESLIEENKSVSSLNNLYFINNKTLEDANLNLYDVLGGTDILITDYSSVYGDFLFLDKPTVFSIYDIDEYRESRGIALEPFDFWTAGPKVKSQNELQEALLRCDDDIYKNQRKNLQNVFYKYIDAKASNRVWALIEKTLKEIEIQNI